MRSDPGIEQLRSNLDHLEGNGRGFSQRHRLRGELRGAVGMALWALFVGPLLLWLMRLIQTLTGQAPGRSICGWC